MKLDPLVCQIITMPNIDHFTVVEVRTAYLMLSNNINLNKVTVRKFVYAELNKLVKRGWLSKTTSDVKGISRFKKTKLFDCDTLKENVTKETPSETPDSSLKKQLKRSLNESNIELLKGLGALETYMNLWQQYPNKSHELKNKYKAVQENNHILEGKIRALKDILSTS
ncbi:hypothetical protein [Pseudoalteromonas sp. NBT06-2]|uniref:hypothetical protein n=1 Tax=Pseudoalteromonas sp. NBT06-2 TaxID=2025950 RepID=UPI001140EA9A|nr:hypothetical protein [Pseudoalteromonas sp. NBT06-2]